MQKSTTNGASPEGYITVKESFRLEYLSILHHTFSKFSSQIKEINYEATRDRTDSQRTNNKKVRQGFRTPPSKNKINANSSGLQRNGKRNRKKRNQFHIPTKITRCRRGWHEKENGLSVVMLKLLRLNLTQNGQEPSEPKKNPSRQRKLHQRSHSIRR